MKKTFATCLLLIAFAVATPHAAHAGTKDKEHKHATASPSKNELTKDAAVDPDFSAAFSEAAKKYAKAYPEFKKRYLMTLQKRLKPRNFAFTEPYDPKFSPIVRSTMTEVSGDRLYVGPSAGAPSEWVEKMPRIQDEKGHWVDVGPFSLGEQLGVNCIQVIDGHTVLASFPTFDAKGREIVAICGLETTKGLVDDAPWLSPRAALFESGTYSYIGTNGARRTVKRLWGFKPEKLHEAGMEILHPELKKAREAKEKKAMAEEAAFVAKEMKAAQASIDSGKVPMKGEVEQKLIGTKWGWWEGQTVIFLQDGRVVLPQHRKTGTWKVVDVKNRIINGTMPWNSKVFIYKFNADFTEAQRAEGKDGNDFKAAVKLIAPSAKSDGK